MLDERELEARQKKVQWMLSLAPAARQAKSEWPGMRVATCLAQAALETGWGKKPIGQFNLWGIKALSWIPGRILVTTHEYVEHLGLIRRDLEFADFSSSSEAFNCYGRLITNSPRYAIAREQTNLEDYTNELCKVWATDPFYAKKVRTIIHDYHLGDIDAEA